MNAADLELLAERERVSVVPNFSEPVLHLITGDVGPFEAGVPVRVPAWVAIHLKQSHKCRVVAPEWLNCENIEALIAADSDSNKFVEVPAYWMCLSHLLLQHASDDIADADRLAVLIKDLWDVRQAKLRTSLREFVSSGESHAVVSNLTPFELNSIRALSTTCLGEMSRLKRVADEAAQHD